MSTSPLENVAYDLVLTSQANHVYLIWMAFKMGGKWPYRNKSKNKCNRFMLFSFVSFSNLIWLVVFMA